MLHHGCALLRLPVLPIAPLDAADPSFMGEPDLHRSFAAGYTKRERLQDSAYMCIHTY